MDAKLKQLLFIPETFSGAEASLKIPLSIDLINQLIEGVSSSTIESFQIEHISPDGIMFKVETTIPFQKELFIDVALMPEITLPDLILNARIVSGLNMVQRLIIDQLAGSKINFDGKEMSLNLHSFIPEDAGINDYLHYVKELRLLMLTDHLEVRLELGVD